MLSVSIIINVCSCLGSLSFNELSGRLSDFGLADEEVENLFFKLDADHSGSCKSHASLNRLIRCTLLCSAGQVERDEFVAGYRSYLDKLNGKPQVVLEKGVHKSYTTCLTHLVVPQVTGGCGMRLTRPRSEASISSHCSTTCCRQTGAITSPTASLDHHHGNAHTVQDAGSLLIRAMSSDVYGSPLHPVEHAVVGHAAA